MISSDSRIGYRYKGHILDITTTNAVLPFANNLVFRMSEGYLVNVIFNYGSSTSAEMIREEIERRLRKKEGGCLAEIVLTTKFTLDASSYSSQSPIKLEDEEDNR